MMLFRLAIFFSSVMVCSLFCFSTTNANSGEVSTSITASSAASISTASSASTSASNSAPLFSEDANISTVSTANTANSAYVASEFIVEKTPAMRQDEADLWQRIRRGFAMEPLASPMVEEREQWYAARQDYIRRFVERGSKYMYHIVEEVERRKMPTEIVLLPIIESAFNPQANSSASASGMWQFIPSTGKSFGLKQDWLTDHRRDVLRSTDAALDYLQKLYGMFNSWELAFAAYNCGEGCVGRAIQANQRKGLPTDFLSLNLPNETRQYVPKLIAVKNIVLSPATYGIELNNVLNQPYFIKVAAPEKMDVKLAARLAEMPAEDFAALNPAFNKPVAASSGYFLVPTAQADVFKNNLDLYRSLNGPMVSWQTVTAKRGEAVDRVAKRYGMTGSYLRATNGGLKERKGKFTQPVTFMVPMSKEAKIIDATWDKKVGMRPATITASSQAATAIAGATANTTAPNVLETPTSTATTTTTVISTASIPYTYQIQSGDTLFAVSKRFNVTIDEIKQINGLRDNQVQIGQILKLINTVGDAAPIVSADANLKPAVGSSTGVAASVSNDLSTRSPAAIARVNAPTYVNQKINTKAETKAGTKAGVKAPAPIKNYIVRNGDTLFAIAEKFDVELEDLLRWNRLSKRAVIRAGAKLRVS